MRRRPLTAALATLPAAALALVLATAAHGDTTTVPGTMTTATQDTSTFAVPVPAGVDVRAIDGVVTEPEVLEGGTVTFRVNGAVRTTVPSSLYQKVRIPVQPTAYVAASRSLAPHQQVTEERSWAKWFVLAIAVLLMVLALQVVIAIRRDRRLSHEREGVIEDEIEDEDDSEYAVDALGDVDDLEVHDYAAPMPVGVQRADDDTGERPAAVEDEPEEPQPEPSPPPANKTQQRPAKR